MAEFCYACSISTFGRDGRDFYGITKEDDFRYGKACLVLCEGCGAIQVDPQGRCLSGDCSHRGENGHGCSWSVNIDKKKRAISRATAWMLSIITKLLK